MNNTQITETSISIEATPAQVWKALTTPELVKKYLMGTNVVSDWREGSAITYNGEYEGKQYHDKGIIKRIVPGEILQSTYWSSMSGKEDKPENYKLVTYVLEKRNGQTVVTLTQDNNATEKEKEHSTENWKTVLKKLKEVVESENK
jgi:uncharacterized protein YndB with AHSA1/START domain